MTKYEIAQTIEVLSQALANVTDADVRQKLHEKILELVEQL
jgi:hypothetical protein